jgi:hypothetical protein
MREETELIHVSMDREFWTTTNMHRYYRYLNSLSRMTVLPKGGNQMNVLAESRVFLLLLAPNSLARINVFDMIWEEILRASWSPLKGYLHAPFIMKMIEVVTQTYFEKPIKHSRYVPYWVDSTNPATRTKRAPSVSRGPASSDEPPPQPPHHPSSSHSAAASRLMDHSGRGSGPGQGRGRGQRLFIRLAKGLLGVFAMCRTRAVEESMRRRMTDRLHEDFLRYAAETGHPLPLGSPPPPTPTFPMDLNEWHQQEFGVPFITPEDEAEEFDDPYYTSDPPHPPPPYSGQGPTPGDPRPSGSGHYPPPPYPGQGPIPGDPRPFGSGYHHHPPPPPPPPHHTSSASVFSAGDEPHRDSSLEEDMMHTFFTDYTSYPPSYPPPRGY